MYDTDTWGVELTGTFVKRKDRVTAATVYRPAGYGVADLMAHWNFAPGATFNVGVFNLGDKRYIDWSTWARHCRRPAACWIATPARAAPSPPALPFSW